MAEATKKNWRFFLPALALGSINASCASVSSVDDADRTLSYGCDDVVVIGRLENGEYEPVEVEGEILGRGWTTAQLAVRRAVKGASVPSSVAIKYSSHAQIRDDRDFMFVLSRAEGGLYEIETAQLMSVRPRLTSQCVAAL